MKPIKTREIKKLLVANRGEIAIRVYRAANELGIRSVGIYSKEDELGTFRTRADESYQLGVEGSPLSAYMNIDDIIALAKEKGVDAIHPGYGFLAENADFARACEEAGIEFVGPPADVLEKMGDKLSAKEIAIACGVPTIPGSKKPLADVEEAIATANEYGYPVILKAAGGGGGRGMRMCESDDDVRVNFPNVTAEATKAFGNGDIFMEKFLVEPKHIEIQVLGDKYGNIVHLFERDCSLQRRYQKVVEYGPAWSIPQEVRQGLYDDAVKVAKFINYESAGTVEFLVDKDYNHYFIEMNPRIQVEHTVTEEITGVDLVRAQLYIAQGRELSDPAIGIRNQEHLRLRGYAIQCRVTTEDPENNFAPDTGTITSYVSGGGNGVRLDSVEVYPGHVVTPYYDSLLVKITSKANTFEAACNKSLRALDEQHIHGVKTNIPFVQNVLMNEVFRAGKCHTKFIDETPELFVFNHRGDRATKAITYLAQNEVDNPNAKHVLLDRIVPPVPTRKASELRGAKQILDEEGPEGLRDWVLAQKKLLITDTTMRDAHQSLLSTRMRTIDMLNQADAMADALNDCFSLEMWGGATFDVAYRFLYESPWQRVEKLREKIPNIPFQMLLRGANAVGYANYPDNVIRMFVKEAAKVGIDIFRVFDALNYLPGIEVAIDEVLNQGKFAEATMCYAGDILDPNRPFDLKYYVNKAKEIEKMGAHSLCIKDMAGLMKPHAAKILISELKQEIGIPIHLHTHDFSSTQIATYMMASEAGVDIVDCAIDSMSSMTAQPSFNSLVASMGNGQDPRDPGFDEQKLAALSAYWKEVRKRYHKFEAGLIAPTADVYRYEMPGGQYTNYESQVKSFGMGDRFQEVREMYRDVNYMLGDIIKVTPSSKMVGDMAIFMVQNDLTPENIKKMGANLAYPDSVISYYKGLMGQPSWGFDPELQKMVLKDEEPITVRSGLVLPDEDFEKVREEISKYCPNPDDRHVISWCMYPKVFEDYYKFKEKYGYLMRMDSNAFFNGLQIGETTEFEMEDGKKLLIKYLGYGEAHEDGTRDLHYMVNGVRRLVTVVDKNLENKGKQIIMADPSEPGQVGAPIPGAVSKVNVKVGDDVSEGDVIAVLEAMKMETSVIAGKTGTVTKVNVDAGGSVQSGELIVSIE